MSRHGSRRDFLQAGALTGFGFWIAGQAEADTTPARRPGPNDRLNIGIIGCGGQGRGNLNNVAGSENIIALCDVDHRPSNRGGPNPSPVDAFAAHPRATRYTDFRQMLDRERTLDAVVVSTPDHMHALAAIRAMRMGKHCYCEKPLTHDVWEARQMKEVARQNRVATQMGNQGTSNTRFREGVELVRSGALGTIREVHVWTNRPIWPQGMTEPAAAQAVPEGLTWDLWLGTATQRAYNQAYMPFRWRGWWDFGTGAIGDMACHTMNLPYLALNLGAPTAVSATSRQPVNNQAPPEGCTIVYEFPARRVPAGAGYARATELPAVRMTWYERGYPPRELFRGGLAKGQRPHESGFLIIGETGTMYSPHDYGGDWRLLPADQFRDHRPPQAVLPRSPGHHREWLRACKGGVAAMSNFDYASALTEAALLGNVAIRAGARIVWDAENLRITNNREANRFIRREYPRGWAI
jgi:predicted dehydrogenase